MDEVTMKLPITVRMDAPLFGDLFRHLFPGDGDEHGAVIAAGMVETDRGTRLLARQLFVAQDGVDYVPGQRGYRALTAKFVAEVSDYCARENLCYLAVHNHGGKDAVEFSADDIASHERGYPALLDITRGGPVGALVFAPNAVAGDIWTSRGRFAVDRLTVVGPRVYNLFPNPPARPLHADPIYDRHARLFGDVGQRALRQLKVGIIGLGGGGSLVNEWLAKLGIGHIVAIDFDRVEPSNLPRIVAATWWDAMLPFARSRWTWVRRLAARFSTPKVRVARRGARAASPSIRYDAVIGNVLDEPTARLLTDTDFLVLASDTVQSRHMFNALIHQYLIPGVQIGAKVTVDRATRRVMDVFTTSRPVLPGSGRGCLLCHELVPAGRLREEALSVEERLAQRYVDDPEVAEPSVISLNVMSAAPAVNDLMMMFTGLYGDDVALNHQMHFAKDRAWAKVEARACPDCLDCTCHPKSRRSRGDRTRLPCRSGG
jgi:tRNA A37 threonylcarbamoyladenosine dehydratase